METLTVILSYLARILQPAGRRTSTSSTRRVKVNRGLNTGNELVNILTGHATQKREPFSTVPFAPDPDFVDRPEILAWIRDKCAGPGSRAALVGLGGVGYVHARSLEFHSSKVIKKVAASHQIRPQYPRCDAANVCVLGACQHQGPVRRSV